MKLKFWKRSNKSKTAKASKGKSQRKSKDCTECESLRSIVEGKFVVLVVIFVVGHSQFLHNTIEKSGCGQWTRLLILCLINFIQLSLTMQSSKAIVTECFNSNRSWICCMISLTRE